MFVFCIVSIKPVAVIVVVVVVVACASGMDREVLL